MAAFHDGHSVILTHKVPASHSKLQGAYHVQAIEENAVMMLTTSVTATTWVLAVLA